MHIFPALNFHHKLLFGPQCGHQTDQTRSVILLSPRQVIDQREVRLEFVALIVIFNVVRNTKLLVVMVVSMSIAICIWIIEVGGASGEDRRWGPDLVVLQSAIHPITCMVVMCGNGKVVGVGIEMVLIAVAI